MSDLQTACETVVARCLDVGTDEEVVIVVDPETAAIGRALHAAVIARGGEPVTLEIEPREVDGQEPPASAAAALVAAPVFLAPTSRSLSHTRARKAASDNGARGATLPGVTEAMFARLMACDFEAMAARSRAVAGLLTDAAQARITCPLGTDLQIDLAGRTGVSDDGDLTSAGAFGNLPCGEGFIAPRGGEGTLVAGSLALLGIPDEPVRMRVRDGRLDEVQGDFGERWAAILDAAGSAGRNLAELGVGTNENAILTGNILEDEKILGTVHIAFGASAGIGGMVSVPVHLDCLIADATLELDGRRVLDVGMFAL